MSLYKDSSLAMIPTAYKDGKLYSVRPTDGSGDFTFSRGTTATRVDVNGLIEKGRENLLLQSNQFDTTWTLSSAISVSGGQSGYDGSNDAWLLERSDASARYIRQNVASSGVHTFSVYAKPESVNWMYMYISDGVTNYNAYFDLSSGALGSTSGVIDSAIESAGNGYYRCSISVNASIAAVRLYPAVADGSITGGVSPAGIYIQDAQLESGLVSTDVITTTTTSVSAGILEDMPRLDYSGGASCPSLLLEPQRSNLVDDYSGYTWDSFNGAAISFTGTQQSPEGLNNAVTWTFGGTSGEVVQRSSISISTATSYTISGYFKLTSGTLTSGSNQLKGLDGLTGGSVSLNTLTSEWQRLSFSVTSSSSSGRVQLRCDNSATIQVYGLQLEAGSYETSIIPTYGSSVTRSADNNNAPFLDIETEGTMFGEVEVVSTGAFGTPMALSVDNATNNFVLIYKTDIDKLSARIRFGGADQCLIDSGTLTEGYHKFAFRYRENDCEFFVDGVSVGTDTSVSIPTGLNVIRQYIGGSINAFVGGTKQLAYFPTALTDSECIALTTL